MPRYRKLHVKALESLDIHEMPDDFTRLFWVLLPLVCDREGRGLDNISWLKSKVFPLRHDVTGPMIGFAWDWFIGRGMVKTYEVAGRSYFWLPRFAAYQGDTDKEAASEYPVPPELVQPISGATPEQLPLKSASTTTTDTTTTTDADTTTTTDEAVAAAVSDLLAFGCDEANVNRQSKSWKRPDLAGPLIAYAKTQEGLTNPQGWVMSKMGKGEGPPKRPKNGNGKDRRSIDGAYGEAVLR